MSPIGIRQFWAFGCSNTSGAKIFGSTIESMDPRDIDSTPPPIPISIYLLLIAFAIVATDYNPDEHYLLSTYKVVVSGNPAKNIPILALFAPDPGIKTLPMQISSTC